MKRILTLLLCITLLCGCSAGKTEPEPVEKQELPETYDSFVIGDKGFYVNTEGMVEMPDIECIGLFQFIDSMYYVGVVDNTTFVLGHLKDGIKESLQETKNAAVTFYKMAFDVDITGTEYDTAGIIEDESEVGELGYHIKLLDEDLCVVAFIYNNPVEDTSVKYYNEVDNAIFDNVYDKLPEGYKASEPIESAIQTEITATYLPENLGPEVWSFACFYNDDRSICVLKRTYEGKFEWENNIGDRFKLDEANWQYVIDTKSNTSWTIAWASNPNADFELIPATEETENFGTK